MSAGALIPVRLSRVEPVAVDICLFELSSLGGEPLPVAAPGAHIDVHLPQGLIRQYSLLTPLCGPTRYVVAVKRHADGRGGSQCLHDDLKPGASLQIGAPRNQFPLNEYARQTVLLAGGIGITPIYGMFERLQQIRRSVQLHYWSRTPQHSLFRDRLAVCANASLHVSAPGRVTLTSVLEGVDPECEIYCCGPERMLQEFAEATQRRTLRRLHVERFSALGAAAPSAEFTVVLAKSKREVRVRSGETILDALRNASVSLSYSCEEGICGACEVKYLAGDPVHRDAVRTPTEHQRLCTVMICCAGSRSERLTLDL